MVFFHISNQFNRRSFLWLAQFLKLFKINYMFRVICIDAKQTSIIPQAEFILKENEEYEVISSFYHYQPDWLWYELSIQPKVGYAAERFVRLSDIDETEMIREEKTTCATI